MGLMQNWVNYELIDAGRWLARTHECQKHAVPISGRTPDSTNHERKISFKTASDLSRAELSVHIYSLHNSICE